MDVDRIRLYANKAMEFFGNAFIEASDDALDNAYFEGIEIGIRATISSLYESGASDEKTIDLLNKYWDIPRQEAIDRLKFEKTEICKRELKDYLALQGWPAREIDSYFKRYNAGIKIKNNSELWGLWNKPEKLKQQIEKL